MFSPKAILNITLGEKELLPTSGKRNVLTSRLSVLEAFTLNPKLISTNEGMPHMGFLKGRIYPDSLPDEFRFWKVSVLVLPMPYNPKVGSSDAGKSPVGLLLPDLAAAVVVVGGVVVGVAGEEEGEGCGVRVQLCIKNGHRNDPGYFEKRL